MGVDALQKHEAGRLTVACSRFVNAASGFLKAVLSPTVQTYFLWSALIWIGAGVALGLGRPQVETFMCNVDVTDRCTACSSQLSACSKNACYRDAINITVMKDAADPSMSTYSAMIGASADVACFKEINDFANNPVQMVLVLSALPGGTITQDCMTFNCQVLKNALTYGDLNSLSGPDKCTDSFGTKRTGDAGSCTCGDLVADIDNTAAGVITASCGSWMSTFLCSGNSTPSWCPATPAPPPSQSPSPAGSGGTSARRLWYPKHSDDWDEEDAWSSDLTVRGLQASTATTTASSSGAGNSALPEYVTNPWSPCNCYQQCMPGIRQRVVQCTSNACKDPKPATVDLCRCDHCANCMFEPNMLVLMACFFGQGGLSFLVFLCYLLMGGVSEESLVKLNYSKWFIGFVCKQLPPIVRILVIVNVIQVIIILALTWAGKVFNIAWMAECYACSMLRTVSLVLAGLWTFQVLFGRFAKTYARKPPWLYTPVRSSMGTPFRQIAALFRCLGP